MSGGLRRATEDGGASGDHESIQGRQTRPHEGQGSRPPVHPRLQPRRPSLAAGGSEVEGQRDGPDILPGQLREPRLDEGGHPGRI